MSNRWYTQFVHTHHKKLVEIDCNFIVDSTNGNGFGARALKGAGVQRVFMNTSASFSGTTTSTSQTITGISSGTSTFQIGAQVTGTGIPAGALITSIPSSSSITISQAATGSATETINYFAPGSPRPAAGIIYVTFQDNFNYYYFGTAGFVSPLSGTPISISTGSSLTIGNPYTIVSLGTTTTAQWVAVGVPIGTNPQIGVTFIASNTSGSGTGMVEAPLATGSGVDHAEPLGDPNTTITSQAANVAGVGGGAYMVLQCFKNTAITAPANGTVVGLSFFFSNSYIQIRGD
jgi:hypothetical protein